jgi:NTE family protein
MTGRALVLGGGGITGIAWDLGLMAGLREHGVDLADADLIVGTSAGAYVGALLATGVDPTAVGAAGGDLTDLAPRIDLGLLAQVFATMSDHSLTPQQARIALGRLALDAPVGDATIEVDRFAARLPAPTWPTSPRLVVTAVHTGTGEPVVWDASAGVPLATAVAASCAVPGVFPPVQVGDAGRFMDGGVRSVTNADLAAGAEAVVVVAPTVGLFRSAPRDELRALGAARTVLLSPDPAARAAIGPNILDQGRWHAALAAGHAQASGLAASVTAVWRPST